MFLVVNGVARSEWTTRQQYGSRAERIVWRELFSQLKPGEAILPGIRLTDPRHGDVEADVLIFVPDLGIAVLEVKGGKVVYEEGEWTTRRRRRHRRVQPVQQARRAKHALRRYLDRQPEWHRGLVRATWFVVFPNTVVTGDLGPEGRRAQIIDQLDLPQAMARIRKELANSLNSDPFPDHEDIDTAISLILRDKPDAKPRRHSRIFDLVRNIAAFSVVIVATGLLAHWTALTWGWSWGVVLGGILVPAVSTVTWFRLRHQSGARAATSIAAAGTAVAAIVGAGTVMQAQEPWLLQSTCAQGYAPCLPIVDDLDCTDIQQVVSVRGNDPYELDRNDDGAGCETFNGLP